MVQACAPSIMDESVDTSEGEFLEIAGIYCHRAQPMLGREDFGVVKRRGCGEGTVHTFATEISGTFVTLMI